MRKWVRKYMLGLACFLLLLSNVFIARADDWPYWGHNLKNGGSTSDIGPAANNLIWKYDLGQCSYFTSPMIISKDTGFITDDSGKVFAIDLKNPQRMKWAYQLESSYSFPHFSPVAEGNKVYLGQGRKIYALDAENGMLQKTYETESGILGFTVYDGRIYIAQWDKLTALEADTGGIKWQFKFLDNDTPIADSSNHANQLNDPRYPAIDTDRNVIYITDNSYLYALNLSDGITKWIHEFPHDSRPPIAEDASLKPYPFYGASSPVTGSDGVVYVNYGNNLWAIHPESTVKWSFKTEKPIASAVAVNQNIYVGDWSGKLYALAKDDASLLWNYQTQGPIFTPPVIGGDGSVYLASGDGIIYDFSDKGDLIWVYGTNHCYMGWFSGLSLSNGNLYVASQNELLTFSSSISSAPTQTLNIFTLFN